MILRKLLVGIIVLIFGAIRAVLSLVEVVVKSSVMATEAPIKKVLPTVVDEKKTKQEGKAVWR